MITLTDTAASKVKDLIEAEGEADLALRVAVRPGGCSGFSYEMFFDSDVEKDDLTVDFERRPRRRRPVERPVCSTAPSLDYKDGLQQAGFSINEPQRPAHLRLRPVLQLIPATAAATAAVMPTPR